MKIIDLLNKIANGEEIPKKIKYEGDIYIYNYDMEDYISDYGNYGFFETSSINRILKNEVEIIEEVAMVSIPEKEYFEWVDFKNNSKITEEDKKIKRLLWCNYNREYTTEILDEEFSNICKTINEIINKLNKE